MSIRNRMKVRRLVRKCNRYSRKTARITKRIGALAAK